MNYADFTKETIDIFTLVTGPYKFFFKKFIESIENFFPNNPKRIHIASDGLDEYSNGVIPEMNIKNIEVTHIIDLPFPLIPIQKTYMQKNYVPEDCKYIFYFDIDTVFLGMPDEKWEFLFEKINDDNIIMSKHPHYDSQFEANRIFLMENNADSKAYIPEDYYEHVISSFWGGKRENVLKMDDYVNYMFKWDIKNIRYFPIFVDENYINKIIWQTKKGEITDIKFYDAEHFITIPNYEFSVETPHIFLLQKYDTSIKNSKKNVE